MNNDCNNKFFFQKNKLTYETSEELLKLINVLNFKLKENKAPESVLEEAKKFVEEAERIKKRFELNLNLLSSGSENNINKLLL